MLEWVWLKVIIFYYLVLTPSYSTLLSHVSLKNIFLSYGTVIFYPKGGNLWTICKTFHRADMEINITINTANILKWRCV